MITARRRDLTRRHSITIVACGCAVVAAAWIADATVGRSVPAGKSGASSPEVLTLAVAEYQGKPADVIAGRFARRVEALSHGSMRVVIEYWPTKLARGTSTGEVEASAIRAVESRDVQLGLVPSHAFAAQHVTTLAGLQTPFVITSPTLAARATTGAIADRLLAGLQTISLEGLGLVPEGLERPFGFLKPLLAPADFAGVTIRADSSQATRDLLRALGATPRDLTTVAGHTSVYSGFVNDAVSIPSADDGFPKDAYTGTGVVLFPKVDVLIASRGLLDHLRPSQRETLRRAAEQARAETVAASDERADGSAFCRAGGTIVATSPSALGPFRAKTAELRRSAAALALLRALGRPGDRAVPAVQSCTPGSAAGTQVAPDNEDYTHEEKLALLPRSGTYRRAFTIAQLRAAGANETEARRNAGVTTLTLYNSRPRQRFVVEWQGSTRPPCRGRVHLFHRRVELRWYPTTPCSGWMAFSWKHAGHGDFELVDLDPATEPAWLRKAYPGTWKRVNCSLGCGAREKLTAGEASAILQRRIPGRPWVACHHVPSVPSDYRCHYTYTRNGQRVRVELDVNVDDAGITRIRQSG